MFFSLLFVEWLFIGCNAIYTRRVYMRAYTQLHTAAAMAATKATKTAIRDEMNRTFAGKKDIQVQSIVFKLALKNYGTHTNIKHAYAPTTQQIQQNTTSKKLCKRTEPIALWCVEWNANSFQLTQNYACKHNLRDQWVCTNRVHKTPTYIHTSSTRTLNEQHNVS